jgi:hypothetical protein
MGFTSNCAYQTDLKTNEGTQTKAQGAAEQRARRGLPTIKHGKERRSELRVYDEEKAKRYYSDCGPCSSKRNRKKVKFVLKMVNTTLVSKRNGLY